MNFISLILATSVFSVAIDNSKCQYNSLPLPKRYLNCYAKPPTEPKTRPGKAKSAVYFYDPNLMQCRKKILYHAPSPCVPFYTMEDCLDACIDQTSSEFSEYWVWLRF
ncbi:hypothetical protein DSO57_1014244 [Entomophthora muscae]|uniref:Uncharacterized protein n=2 Tax=Entomophthora muscae TaxID=34485 RepID=A0ACC2UF00_9FUNG|nr:hypothetical protein DSO57_1035760 [Entomophthora muscae]KAJ9085415.1 hypothetical protein DSO57_1014244 [Entomophthora muscae]